MARFSVHKTVAHPGRSEFLLRLQATRAAILPEEQILSLMAESGTDDPATALKDLMAVGLLCRIGASVGLTRFGARTCLLLEALNGSDMRDVCRRLARFDTRLRMYTLVREGMVARFLESLALRPCFDRLYVCSPWISLDDGQQALLAHAMADSKRRRGQQPEIFVLTRPTNESDTSMPSSIEPLLALGATVFLNPRLHTKLYIRDGGNTGYSLAVMGSQNLSRSNYLELGISITGDSPLLRQLITYFWELCGASDLAQEIHHGN